MSANLSCEITALLNAGDNIIRNPTNHRNTS